MMRPLNHITVEGMNCPVSRIVSFGAAGHGGHKRLKMWPRNPFSKWREVISPVGVGVKLLFCYANQ